MSKRRLIIVPETEDDKFTLSTCDCDLCKEMHVSIEEWDTFEANTCLQKGMKKVIKKIEKRIRKKSI